MNDVAGKAPQAEREFSAEIEKCAHNRENTRNKEQRPAEFPQWIHLCARDLD